MTEKNEHQDNQQRRRRRGNINKVAKRGDRQKSLLVELDEGQKWFDYNDPKNVAQKQLRNATLAPSDTPNDKSVVEEYRRRADEIYEKETQLYRDLRKNSSTSDDRWVESTIRKGTLKDRIAAMSVVVVEDPLHQPLDGLIQMCCGVSSNTRVAQLAGEALEDLFANTLLPPQRKLISLDQRPLTQFQQKNSKSNSSSTTLSPRILLLWRFEELLRDSYNKFLQDYVHRTLHSRTVSVDHQRAALRTAAALLRSVPEGESALLRLIVDQLSNNDIHAAASHALVETVQAHHPAMQPIIAREVQQLAYTSRHTATVCRAVTVLMQFRLKRGVDSSLAGQLLDTYFRLFQQATQDKRSSKAGDKQNQESSKLVCALLTGIHRAYPFVDDESVIAPHIDVLYKLVHTAPNMSSRLQALLVLQQVASGNDRLYRAIYSATDQLVRGTKTAAWNLLYKTIKDDDATTARACSMIKTVLIQGGLHGTTSATVAASLYLVNSVIPSHLLQAAWMDPTNSTIVWDPSAREPKGALKEHASLADPKQSDHSSMTNQDERIAPMWEVTLLGHHYHPTVKTFARKFGDGQYEYNGDPLRDFSLGNFLDKLAYRNPKQRQRENNNAASVAAVPVNDPSFLQATNIQEDEKFFHHYFVQRAKRKAVIAEQEPQPDIIPQEDDDTDDEEEAFVNALSTQLLQESGGGQPFDMDDELQTDDWGDIYESDNGNDESDASGSERKQGILDDEDEFMDQASSSDGGSDAEQLIEDDGSEDSEAAPLLVKLPTDSVFADAEEYSTLIYESLKKRSKPDETSEVEDVPARPKSKKKRRKNKKVS